MLCDVNKESNTKCVGNHCCTQIYVPHTRCSLLDIAILNIITLRIYKAQTYPPIMMLKAHRNITLVNVALVF